MSSGTSAGNIITEAAGVYAVRPWLTTVKADAFGVISDAQLDAIIGANWFNNVDDTLVALNAWFNGTGMASHIRATTATIGTCNFTTLAAATAMIGSGSLADAPSSADDVVVGNLGATDRGVTILSTTVGRLAFVDVAATLTGFIAYTHTSDTLSLGVAGATEVNLTASELAPHADGGLTLGTASRRWSEVHATDITAYGDLTVGDAATVQTSVTIGDGTAAASLAVNKDGATNGDILLRSDNLTRWRWRHKSDGNLSLDRLDGAEVLTDSTIINGSTGAWVLPAALSVSGDMSVDGAAIDFTNTGATVTLGDGNNTTRVVLDGAAGYLTFRDTGVDAFDINYDGNGLNFNRYSGGVYQDAVFFEASTGYVYLPRYLKVGNASASAPTLAIDKDNTGQGTVAWQSESVDRWAFVCDASENLLIKRYNGAGALQDTTTVSNTTGKWTFAAGIGVSGTTRQFTAGSGVPTGGTNGDLYWRVDGTASTCLYYRVGGVWTALAT